MFDDGEMKRDTCRSAIVSTRTYLCVDTSVWSIILTRLT